MRGNWDLAERTVSCFEDDRDLDQFQLLKILFSSRRRNETKHRKPGAARCVSRVFRFVLSVFAAAVSLAFPMRCRRRFGEEAVGGVPFASCSGTGGGVPVSPLVYVRLENRGKIKEYSACSSFGVGGFDSSLCFGYDSFPVVVIPPLSDLCGGWSSCALRC